MAGWASYHKVTTPLTPEQWDDLKKTFKARYEKERKKQDERKKREGYKFWCYTPAGYYKDHRVYFRTPKSAKEWVNKHPNISDQGIYPL